MKRTKIIALIALSLMSFKAYAQDIYVKKISVDGLQRVEPETVYSYLNIKQNSKVTQDELDAAFKHLYDTGLFSDINFDTSSGNILTITVKENPIIGKVAFDGNDKIDDKILETELLLSSRSVYDKAKVQQDVQRILDVYRKTGNYSVSVEPKIIEREDNRIDLIYEIDEGKAAKIDKINFLGNTHYSSADLQDEIMSKESRWYRIFTSAETYDADKMNYDKELLRIFYTSRGYADFKVDSAIAELSSDNKSFTLTYSLDEGVRYKVDNISISSAIKDIDTKALYTDLQIEQGNWYNAELVEKSIAEITESLGRKGFAFVNVDVGMERNNQDGKINLVFNISESERIFVNRINITGNDRTTDEVIRREFRVDEGDALNISK